jgi:hypothetical protein
MTPSDDLIREHAYLVARGVRALAIVGECSTDTVTMLRTATQIETLSVPGAIPFLCDCQNGFAEYGYAAERWVVDLFEWLMTADANVVPTDHRHHVLGLLLGYSATAVRDFEAHTSGRRFTDVRYVRSE